MYTDVLIAWLVTYGVHSTLLLGAVWLLAKKLPLAGQEVAWKAALVGGVLTASIQIALGGGPALAGWSVPAQAVEPAAVEGTAPTPNAVDIAAVPVAAETVSRAAAPTRTSAALTPTLERTTSIAGSTSSKALSWKAGVAMVWGMGAGVLLLLLAISYFRLARRLAGRRSLAGSPIAGLLTALLGRAGLRRTVGLSGTPRIQVPLARGVLKGEICLPRRAVEELAQEEQEGLLAHELAHVARRDPAWLLLARVLENAFFFQPLNRLARRRLQHIAEYRADEWAVRQTGQAIPLARCLTQVATWNLGSPAGSTLPVPAMAAERATLGERVERLLAAARGGIGSHTPRWLGPAAAAALVLMVLAAPGMTHAVGDLPPVPEAPPAPEAPPEPADAPEPPEPAEVPEPPAPPEAPGPPEGPEPPEPPAPPEAPEPPEGPEPPEPPPAPRVEPVPEPTALSAPAPAPLRLASAFFAALPAPDGEPEDEPDVDEEWEQKEALIDETVEAALESLDEVLEADFESIEEEMELAFEGMEEVLEQELEEPLEAEEEAFEEEFESMLEELEDLGVDEEEIARQVDAIHRDMAERAAELGAKLGAQAAELAQRTAGHSEMQEALELRMEALHERLEPLQDELTQLAQEAASQTREGGEIDEATLEELRTKARRMAEEARPSDAELRELREQARRMAEKMKPSEAELQELRTHALQMRQEIRRQREVQLREMRELLDQKRQEMRQDREELRQQSHEQREEAEQRRAEARERAETRERTENRERTEARERAEHDRARAREAREQARVEAARDRERARAAREREEREDG